MVSHTGFGAAVAEARRAGRLVVQPRMGFARPAEMRAGLWATRRARATTVGTITLDSYTRVEDHRAAEQALAEGADLNGYPIVAHPRAVSRAMLRDVMDDSFPVQVRHGSARPTSIIEALTAVGVHSTEGGPVSYCLPYSRRPLTESVREWARACESLAAAGDRGPTPHLETFGGCILGQLCPPSLLVAMSVLEALFFRQHGLRSVSLSYAQQTNPAQDREAVAALRQLAGEHLDGLDWHVVIYAYMGLFPRTRAGALALLTEAAHLATVSGADRLIVKTTAEAFRIPTIAENVAALEHAARAAEAARRRARDEPGTDTAVGAEARTLVEAVLDLNPNVGRALVQAFACGYLDIPYCLHPDNAGHTAGVLDDSGRLVWVSHGALPLGGTGERTGGHNRTGRSDELLMSLSYVQRRFDRPYLDPMRRGTP